MRGLVPRPDSEPRLTGWDDYGVSESPSASPSEVTIRQSSPSSISTRSSSVGFSSEPKRRLACARCRRLKEKCVFESGGCTGCVGRGLRCSGPVATTAAQANYESDSSSWPNKPRRAVVSLSAHVTATGRARLLGPTSSEASLNQIQRATALRADLMRLYRSNWPVQPSLLPATVFEDLTTGPRDEARRVFLSICTALGARSSSHSEIVQQVGPSLDRIELDLTGQFTRGGLAEWGIRRNGACIALGHKAIEQTRGLINTRPTFRTLKLAMAAHSLNVTLTTDYTDRRAFLLETIGIWRKLVIDPRTTPDQFGLLLHSFAPGLMLRDLIYAMSRGTPCEFSATERSIIANANPINHAAQEFALPDCAETSGLIVFEEEPSYRLFSHAFLWATHALGLIFADGPLVEFGPAQVSNLRQIWAFTDDMVKRLTDKRERVRRLPPGAVVVLSEWKGGWRPKQPKEHAIVMFNEVISEMNDTTTITHIRLQLEWRAGRLNVADQAVAAVVAEARERCRRVIKTIARSIQDWMPALSKHAHWASLFHSLSNVSDWIELALGRWGEHGGPVEREDELSVEEVELLVRGLRVGSFSQSSLVTAMRELERGLEILRRHHPLPPVNSAASNELDVTEYLVGLAVGAGQLSVPDSSYNGAQYDIVERDHL